MANESDTPQQGVTPQPTEGLSATTQAMIGERMLAEMMGMRSILPGPSEQFILGIKDYAEKEAAGALTDDERKEMQRRGERFSTYCLQPLDKLFKKTTDRKENAVPFRSGYGEAVYSNLDDTLTELGEQEWMKEGSEAWMYLKNAERDLVFSESLFQTAIGLSASKPGYFDVIVQLSTLKQQRSHILTSDLEGTWSGKLEGLEFESNEIEPLKRSGVGIVAPETYKVQETGLYSEFGDRNPGLRELAVKFQDDRMAWVIKIAAAAQFDYRKNFAEASFMGNNLKKEELDFINALFGKYKDGDFHILSSYISSKNGDRKEFYSLLQSLLLTNAHDRLQSIIKGQGDKKEKANKISELVTSVKAVANDRMINWRKKDLNDPLSKLAKIVVKQGALQDYSLMTAVDFCWEYIWTGKGLKEVKKVDFGGINSDSGDLPSLLWVKRRFHYALMSNSASPFLPPTSKASRAEMKKLAFDEVPEYNPDAHPDDFLREQWKFLFSDDPVYKQQRQEMGYPDIPPQIAETLKKWAWKWGTPFSSSYVGEESKYDLDIIFFMQPDLAIANFFRAATDLEGKLNNGAKSVMQQLIEGKKQSEINLNNIDDEQVDRWLVDCEMASRYMRILIEVFDKERDPFYALVAGDPSTLGPQELAKRLRLTFRDSEDAPPSVYELALVPFFVTQACAAKYGISGAYAWEQTTEEDLKTNTCPADRFFREMAYWMRALRWLPGERGVAMGEKGWTEEDHYGKTMTLLAEHYVFVLSRVAKSSSEESKFLANQNYKNTSTRIKDLNYLNKYGVKYQPKETISFKRG